MLPFSVIGEDGESAARAAELTTPHGVVHTPAFMPVGTAGTVVMPTFTWNHHKINITFNTNPFMSFGIF